MQLKFFTFTILEASIIEEQINKFMRSVRVLEIKREVVIEGATAYWVICILYVSTNDPDPVVKNKTDYKELLSEDEFKIFSRLRKVRKLIAEEDAVPAFAVFSDQELSEISKLSEITTSSIKKIKGIGNRKIEKYGQKFCELADVTMNEEER